MQSATNRESAKQLGARVIEGAREFSIGTVLFHRVVGQILGVNITDMKCLDMLTQHGETTPSQLAAHTGLTSGATTAMIDRLEKASLVERLSHPKDRRGTILALTREAKRKLPSLFGSLGTAMEELVSNYSPKDLAVLNDFFTKANNLWLKEREKLQRRYDR